MFRFSTSFEQSEEFKKTKGLGLVKDNVVSLDKNKMIVYVGWNQVETTNQNNSIPKNMNSFTSYILFMPNQKFS